MPYVCTHIDKHVQADYFNEGVRDNATTCVMDEQISIEANTLRELFDAISARYALPKIDDLSVSTEVEEPSSSSYVSWNRTETEDGCEPTDSDRAAWERGELTLYLADWGFTIEYRLNSLCVTAEDLRDEGFAIH